MLIGSFHGDFGTTPNSTPPLAVHARGEQHQRYFFEKPFDGAKPTVWPSALRLK